MMMRRPFIGVLAIIAVLSFSARPTHAQGVTTGGVTGTVTDENAQPVEGAQIQLRSTQTGTNIGSVTRANGQYTIQGVLPGSGYEVTVRRIGYAPLRRQSIIIVLGQVRREDFKLTREAATRRRWGRARRSRTRR